MTRISTSDINPDFGIKPNNDADLLQSILEEIKKQLGNAAKDIEGFNFSGLPVNDLDELRAIPQAQVTGVRFVYGHTSANDGGHGYFIGLKTGGTYTDDDGITIVPTGGDGSAAWLRVYSDHIDVKWFGAVGDGVADDTTPWTSAVAAVGSSGGTIVGRRGDTYRITSAIGVSDKDIRIDGNGCTFMQAGGNSIFSGSNTLLHETSVSSASGTTITVAVGSGILSYLDTNSEDRPVLKIVSDDGFSDIVDAKQGEFVRVSSVDTGTGDITVLEPLKGSYSTTIRVAVIPKTKLSVESCTFDTEDITFTSIMVFLTDMRKPELRSLQCIKNGTSFIAIKSCYQYIIENCVIENLTDDTGNNRFGYGVEDSQCEGGLVSKCQFTHCRHGYTTARGNASASDDIREYGLTRHARVVDCHGWYCSAATFDAHPAADNVTFEGCASTGGQSTGAFQTRGRAIRIIGCESFGDNAFVVARSVETYIDNCHVDLSDGGEIFSVRSDAKVYVDGGDYAATGDTGSLIRDGGLLHIRNARVAQSTSSNNISTFIMDDDNATLLIDGGEVDMSGYTGTGCQAIKVKSGTSGAEVILRGGRFTFGSAASLGGTSLLRNDASALFIADEVFLDAVPSGGSGAGFLRFGPTFGTYSAGSGHTYRTEADRTLAQGTETATGTFTASTSIVTTLIDSSGGAVTVTLPDGDHYGQRKIIHMTDASTSSTVSVTNHETSSPEVFTFADADDRLTLEWDGVSWWTVKNTGAAT